MNCRLCNYDKSSIFYEGPIRSGGVGAKTIEGYKILRCEQCSFVYLDPMPENLNKFYETHEYRSNWDYDFSPEAIQKKYDHEQNKRILRIGIENIRNVPIVDIGASAGVFLDAVQSLASSTVAVEPASIYKDYLIQQGHHHYSYPEDAINAGEKADIVTSFDVIEHVQEPRKLVQSAYELLNPNGMFILSMPNLNDIILFCENQSFKPFFFQIAHLNYFSEKMISVLFENSGFTNIKIDYLHKYGIENLIHWTKFKSPGVTDEINGLFDRLFNEHYSTEVERLGISSHLFIIVKKEDA